MIRDREFLKLWIGQSISEVGSRISREGLPYTALLILSATPGQMGLLAATSSVSILLFSLAAGVIVDRVRRRPVMIWMDIARALLLATIPLAALTGRLTMIQLLTVAALTGICTVLFDVAYQSYLPSLTGSESLLDGNRRLAMSAAGAEILGPSLTGLLVQLITAPIAILIDAVSFVVSAVAVASIRRPEPPPAPSDGVPGRAEVLEGLRLVRSHPVLLALAVRSVMAFLAMGLIMPLYILFAIRTLGMNTAQLGVTIALGGVGAMIGAFISDRAGARWPVGITFFWSAAILGLVQLLIPISAYVPRYAMLTLGLAQLIGDSCWSLLFVSETTFRQRVTEPGALGRVNAIMQLAGRGVLPVGALIGGFLADRIGVVPTMWISTVMVALSSLWLLPVMKYVHSADRASAAV